MKRHRLRIARNVGWLAEFPDDVWCMIIDFLPLDDHMPDLAILLCLVGTSKRMCSLLLQTRLLALFQKVRTFYALPSNMKSDYWLVCIYRFFKAALSSVNLEAYLTQCATNETYKTPEHASNCLSLLHLAVSEGRYLDSDNCSVMTPYRYRPLSMPTPHSSLANLYYFRAATKKVVTVSRMYSEVGIVTHYMRYGKDGLTPLYDQACDILKKNMDETRHVELRFRASRDIEPFASRSLIVDVIRGEGKEPIKTRRPCYTDDFDDLLVTIDGKQHYIYSVEAEPFVRNCFHSSLSVEKATKAFIFDSFHARNWAIVTKSDRFKTLSLSL